MGIEPFLVASSLVCVLAQRLVRVICPHCKESYSPSKQELDFFDMEKPPELLYRGNGCDKCLNKGYLGRTGIYEFLEITPDSRAMIVERRDAKSIRTVAIKSGFRPLEIDGMEKIAKGITTLEEVLRVTQKDLEE